MTEPAPNPRLRVLGLNPDWGMTILRCLDRHPEKRFASAEDVVSAIHGEKRSRIQTRWLKLIALLAFLALLVIFIRVYPWGRVREGSPVVLTQVQNLTQDPELDAATDVLRAQLGQSAHFYVIEPKRIAEILERMRKPIDQKLDPPTAREVALRYGAPLVIYGTLSRLAQGYALNLQIERVKDLPDLVSAEWHQTWKAGTKKDVFGTLREGSRWIRKRAGEAAHDVSGHDRPPEDITTSSWRALRLHMQANDKDLAGEHEAAVLLLKEAIRVDPDFAMAYMRVGDILVALKQWEGFEYWQNAIRLSEKHRLSSREEFRIKGQYFHDSGDLAAAERVYRSFLAWYPNDFLPPFLLGIALADLGREEEGIQYISQAAGKGPANFIAPAHLAVLYMDAHQFDKARAELNKLKALGQQDWSIWLSSTLAMFQDNFDEALKQVNALSDSEDTGWRSRSYALRACWLSELGRYQEGIRVLREGIEFDVPRALRGAQADKYLLLGHLAYRLGQFRVAKDACLRSMALDANPDRSARAGTVLARSGYVSEARRLLQTMPGKPDLPILRLNRYRLEGEIALEEGNTSHAVLLFEQASQFARPRLPREYFARALAVTGDAVGALALYRQIVDHPQRVWASPDWEFPGLWSDALFQCALLTRQLGNSEASSLGHRYLNLRKGSDPGIPDVAQARKLWQ